MSHPHKWHVQLAVAALVVGSTCLASCSSGSPAPGYAAGTGRGTIVVWAHQGQDSEDQALQKTVAGFNASQSGVKVTLKFIPANDYTKTLNATPLSKMPDVLEFDGPTLASLVYDKKMAPIPSYVSRETLDNATTAILKQGTVDNQLYGLGMYDSGLGVFGNKKLLKAAGVDYPQPGKSWTAAQFTAALAKLKAKDPDGEVLDVQENSGLATEWGTYGFSPIVYSAGGALLENGKAAGALDSPAVVKAFKTFQSWKSDVDPNTDGDAMVDGRVALSWTGHWMYPAYSKALGKNLVVLPLPDFGKGTRTGEGSWAWGIGGATKNAKAAGKFMDYLLADKSVTAMTQADGAPPATKTVLEASPLYRKGGPLELFADQLNEPCPDHPLDAGQVCAAVTRPVTAGYPVVTAEFSQALNEIYGGADPKSALSKAARDIDRDFSDNGGYTR